MNVCLDCLPESIAGIALPSGTRHDDAHVHDGSMGGGGGGGPGGDYYNSLVAAAIVACFIFVALVVVTALYLKRTTTYKAIISGSGGPMDNQGRIPYVTLNVAAILITFWLH